MANKSRKNKNYQQRKELGEQAKRDTSMGFGLDPLTGKVKNVKAVTIAVVAAIILFVGVRIWAGYQAAGYNESAKPYIQQVLPKLSTWDADVIKSYMAPETLANIPESEWLTMMTSLAKLGPLMSMEEPEFQSVNSMGANAQGEVMIITYAFSAKYVHGDADLIMVLKQYGDSYQLYRFNVDSRVLGQ